MHGLTEDRPTSRRDMAHPAGTRSFQPQFPTEQRGMYVYIEFLGPFRFRRLIRCKNMGDICLWGGAGGMYSKREYRTFLHPCSIICIICSTRTDSFHIDKIDGKGRGDGQNLGKEQHGVKFAVEAHPPPDLTGRPTRAYGRRGSSRRLDLTTNSSEY